MLDVEPASNIVTEENGGKMLSEDSRYAAFKQTFQNFAHAVGFEFHDQEPSTRYSSEDIEAFIDELQDKFGITSDAEHVILTPDDETALEELSVCGFEKIHACRYLNFGFGRFTKRELSQRLPMYRDNIFVHHSLHETKQYIWMVYVTSDSYADEVKKIFDSLYFEPVEIPMVDVHKLLHEYEFKLNDVYAYCSQEDDIIKQYIKTFLYLMICIIYPDLCRHLR